MSVCRHELGGGFNPRPPKIPTLFTPISSFSCFVSASFDKRCNEFQSIRLEMQLNCKIYLRIWTPEQSEHRTGATISFLHCNTMQWYAQTLSICISRLFERTLNAHTAHHRAALKRRNEALRCWCSRTIYSDADEHETAVGAAPNNNEWMTILNNKHPDQVHDWILLIYCSLNSM